MAISGTRDWFRSSTWDAKIEADFEARLRRARKDGRPQYIRIQATHLLDSSDPAVREAARGLLRRVIAEYPDDHEAKFATEQLGVSLAREGRLVEAEQALRETLRLCAASRIGRSGTSGTPELRLAEIILLGGDAARLNEVAELLQTVQPEVQRQEIMRDVVFRFLLASARLASRRRDAVARQLANQALAVTAESVPSLPRHPSVGRPSASKPRSVDRIGPL